MKKYRRVLKSMDIIHKYKKYEICCFSDWITRYIITILIFASQATTFRNVILHFIDILRFLDYFIWLLFDKHACSATIIDGVNLFRRCLETFVATGDLKSTNRYYRLIQCFYLIFSFSMVIIKKKEFLSMLLKNQLALS